MIGLISSSSSSEPATSSSTTGMGMGMGKLRRGFSLRRRAGAGEQQRFGPLLAPASGQSSAAAALVISAPIQQQQQQQGQGHGQQLQGLGLGGWQLNGESMAQQRRRQQEEQERRRRAASVPSDETLRASGSDASGRHGSSHRRWASLSTPMTMGLESMAEAFPLEQTGQQAVGRHVWVGNGGGGSQPSQQQHQKSPSHSGLASALAPPAEIYSLPPRKSSLTAASSSSASILAIGDPLPASPPPPPPKPPAKSLLGRSYTLRRNSPSSTPDPSSASSPPRAPSRMAAMAAATSSSGGPPSRLASIRQLPISLPIPPPPSSHTSTTTRAGQVTHDFIAPGDRPDFALDRGEPARPRLSAGDLQMTTRLWTPPSTPPESDRASERRPFKDLAGELDVEHFGHLSESILDGGRDATLMTSTRVNHCLPPSPPPEHDAPSAKIEPLPASAGASLLLKRSATIASQVRPRRKPVPTHLAGELAATSSPPQPSRRSSSEEEPPALRQAAQIATMGRPARNPKRNSIGAVYVLQPEMPLM